jgi:subtilisin family serine protease
MFILKWLYIYELPLGVQYGQNCLDFPERTVCFGNEMPSAFDLSFMNVSYNDRFTTECQQQAPWHLARIQNPSSLNYFNFNPYFRSSSNVSFIVMDTWMDIDHEEFEGRAQRLKGFVPHSDSQFPTHATHCAGLIGSKTYGTARDSKIYSVRVLDDEGSGDYSTLIQAIHYVYQQVSQNSTRKFIVSMSLGGPKSDAVNRAIDSLALITPVFVAAGNEGQDACSTTPASAQNVITVAASDPYNNFASFSNRGSCVKLIAPGDSILSLCPRNSKCWMSGTSMATPLAAGLAAQFWLDEPHLKPKELQQRMINQSAKNLIKNTPWRTPNAFLFKKNGLCYSQSLFIQ